MSVKPIVWMGTTLADLRRFPADARVDAGHALYLVQLGEEPPDWRPMSIVGPGAAEIRIHSEREYRVIFVARFAEAVYVLHVFAKSTRRTRNADTNLARARLREILAARRSGSVQLRMGKK